MRTDSEPATNAEVQELREEIADLRRRQAIITYYLQHLLSQQWAFDIIRDLESGKTVEEIANG